MGETVTPPNVKLKIIEREKTKNIYLETLGVCEYMVEKSLKNSHSKGGNGGGANGCYIKTLWFAEFGRPFCFHGKAVGGHTNTVDYKYQSVVTDEILAQYDIPFAN